MNSIIIIVLIFVFKTDAHWKLVWHDEFDENVIDHDSWEIHEGDTKTCDALNIGRLNCFTNSTRNLRLIDGTLALTAIYEKRMNKRYTSAFIKTKKNFTNGKIELRAALPAGKLLSPWIKLVPPRFKNRDGFVRHNQVVVFYNGQSNYIKYGVSLGKNFKGNIEDFPTNGSLNEFHSYSVEWNETDLIWKFDDMVTNSLNLSEVTTFLRDPVILTLYLRVGGQPFNGALSLEDVYEWVCSLLILDYVRYYQWVDGEQDQSKNTEHMSGASVGICKKIMDEIRVKEVEPLINQTNLTAIIAIVCLVILLALIPLIFWLVIRMKKMRNPVGRVNDLDNYYDDIGQMEMYEEVNKDTNYDYANPYEYDLKRNANCYTTPEQGYTPIVVTNNDGDYITMTAKSVKPISPIEQEYDDMMNL